MAVLQFAPQRHPRRAGGRTTGMPAPLTAWYDRATPKGVLGLQMTFNGAMLSALIFLAAYPWAALAVLAVLFALTVRLHGRGRLPLLAVYGVLAWAAEAWLVGFGGVWQFAHPASDFADGGLFGVPFYMAPAWSLTGAALLAMAPLFPQRT
jgi:hypothetical protein